MKKLMNFLIKHDGWTVVILFILMMLLSALLAGCNDESAKPANNVTFSVEARTGECLDDYVFVAVVDKDDKLNWAKKFSCYGQEGTAHVDSGDLLELRVTTEGTIDPLIIYDYKVYYNGDKYEHRTDYKGIKFLVP